jgi:clan AA aspartic protease
MGMVMTKLTLWNNTDLDMVARGLLAPDAVRTEEVDALVDTGAVMLVLPIDLCLRLGLTVIGYQTAKLADGTLRRVPQFGSLRIRLVGREMNCDVMGLPEGTMPLIGQIPLEGLDLIVDPRSQEVRVNPASPDIPTTYIYRAA